MLCGNLRVFDAFLKTEETSFTPFKAAAVTEKKALIPFKTPLPINHSLSN